MKTIGICTQKGGVSKTSSVWEIAAILSVEHDKKVLLVDLDQQCNLTSLVLSEDYEGKTIYDVLHKPESIKDVIVECDLFDFIPASAMLSMADVEFNKSADDIFLLDDALDHVKDDYDFVLIDSSPERSKLIEMIYVASSYIISPSDSTNFGVNGILQVYNDIEKLRKARIPLSKAVIMGAIISRYRNTKVCRAERDILRNVMEQINDKAFVMTVRQCTAVDESKFVRKPLQIYAPYSTASMDYKDITQAILDYIANEGE